MAIFQQLNRQRGITIVLVTHEPDIAQCANRIIQFHDGQIIRDEPVSEPRLASAELAEATAGKVPA